jgi:hypothetical protein
MADSQHEQPRVPPAVRSIYPPLVLMTISGILTIWSFQYGETARMLPSAVAGVTFILSVLDLVSRFGGRFAKFVRFSLGAGFDEPEMTHNPRWPAEVKQILWMTAVVAAMALIGILPAIPLFVFFYMFISGRQSLISSLLTAIVLLAIVWVVFEILLGYELYRGLLLDPLGF